MFFPRYVNDGVIGHDGVERAGRERQRSEIGLDRFQPDLELSAQAELACGEVQSDHFMASVMKSLAYRNPAPGAGVENTTSWVEGLFEGAELVTVSAIVDSHLEETLCG
jgi:hypothetical protein